MSLRKAFILAISFCSLAGAQGVEVRLDYLAWKPFGASIAWAQSQDQTSPSLITRTNFFLNPDFRSGVRAEISMGSCETPLRGLARYYWVEHKSSARLVNGENELLAVNGTVGNSSLGGATDAGAVGKARLKQPFHAADIFVGYDFCPESSMDLVLMGGGTLLYLDRSYQAFLISSTESFGPYSTRSRFSGGGPAIGMQLSIPVWNFDLTGEVIVAGLVGKRLNRRQGALLGTTGFDRIVNPTMTGFATGVFAHLGLGYSLQEYCLGFEFGWEQRAYHDVTAIRLASIESAEEEIMFVNMGGPYVGINYNF